MKMKMRWVVGAAAAAISISHGGRLSAQITVPRLEMEGRNDTVPFPVSMAQGAFNTDRLQNTIAPGRVNSDVVINRDSVERIIGVRASAWLKRLAKEPAIGDQLDSKWMLEFNAGQVDEARREIDQRLATPGLSLSDRLFILETATLTFMNPLRPEWAPIAEGYLNKFLAAEPSGGRRGSAARKSMFYLYHALGREDKVLEYGRKMLDVTPGLPYERRSFSPPLLIMADKLRHTSEGRAELQRYLTMLRDACKPSEADIARDSANLRNSAFNCSSVENLQKTIAMIGVPAPSIVGHAWFNHPDSGYAAQPLNDGKIRVLEVGELGCTWCIVALPMMKRLSAKYASVSNVEMMYVTTTTGVWDTKMATPEQEVAGLKAYYVGRRKITFPIAVWAPGRKPNENGEMMVPESDNNKTLNVLGTPRFLVTDGHGIVRYIIDGYSPSAQSELDVTIGALLAESSKPATGSVSTQHGGYTRVAQ